MNEVFSEPNERGLQILVCTWAPLRGYQYEWEHAAGRSFGFKLRSEKRVGMVEVISTRPVREFGLKKANFFKPKAL